MFELRNYQKNAVAAIESYMNNKSDLPSVVVAPTGAGKSILIAQAAMLANGPVLVLQPSKELLIQNYNKYISYGNKAHIYSSSLKSKKIGKITFATPMSVVNEIDTLIQLGVKTVIVDECDQAYKRGSSIHKIVKGIEANKVIGLTATPIVMKQSMEEGSVIEFVTKNYHSFWRDIIHVTQIQELIDNGYWSNVEYRVFNQDTSQLKLNTSGTEYTEKSVRAFYNKNKLSDQIKRMVERLCNFNSILIFVPSVDYAKELESHIPESKAVYGDLSPDLRDMYISDFKKKKIRTLINVNVLGTGFDFPELDAIIHARPTGSVRIWYQHIGRLVRIHENKKRAIVVDLSGNTQKFGPVQGFKFEKHPDYGWVMLSGNNIISDVPRKFRVKIKAGDSEEILVEPSFSSGFEVVPFGQNKGKRLKEVETRYLLWLSGDKFEPGNYDGKMVKLNACRYLSALYKREFFIKKKFMPQL